MEARRSYFMRRAAQERSAADRAIGDAARNAHLELEKRYRDLVGRTAGADTDETASAA